MSETGERKKRVLLGTPAYGGLTEGAARGIYRAGGKRAEVLLCQVNNSLLAHSFNLLWCKALNERRKNGLDYFAMQHADIEPQPGWLDVLIDELEAKQLDVLGVAVAIKDPRGLTSTAVARSDGDPWRTHCRLTMHELHRLPETFTSDDIGGRPLLLNTGLWVCKFGEWADQVHFTINDRICVDPETGEYFAQVESEDWFFSRLLHEQGLKIGCTRKVPVDHRGNLPFTNSIPWGAERYDGSHLERSILDDVDEPIPLTLAGD